MFFNDLLVQQLNVGVALRHTGVGVWPLTSLLVSEDQRVCATAGDLNHPSLLRPNERQRHRGRFQHVVVAPVCWDKGSQVKQSGVIAFSERYWFGVLRRLSCVRWKPSWESLLRPIPHTLITSLVVEAMSVKP